MYFRTPNYSVAFNPKAASSTLARSIIRDFYPNIEKKIQNAAKGLTIQFVCPKEQIPTKPVVLILRNPIERFKSAMLQLNLTNVEEVLNILENNTWPPSLKNDIHFKYQYILVKKNTKIFKLDDLKMAAQYIGLSIPLLTINEGKGEKPNLTSKQIDRIINYYAIDDKLYNSTPTEGMNCNPVTPHLKAMDHYTATAY